MPSSPNVQQGNLNRLKGSIVIPNFPSINVTAAFLGKEGFSASFGGPATDRLPTMTGVVNSPAPYRLATITIHLIKSQGLAQGWKAQEELNTLLGPISFRVDVAGFPIYAFDNCSLDGIQNLTVNGSDPNFLVTIGGVYYINSGLWG